MKRLSFPPAVHDVWRLSVIIGISFLIGPDAWAQTGACCQGNGVCIITDEAGCASLTGEYLGDGTSCADTDCKGACCGFYGNCDQSVKDDCIGGIFKGVGTTCFLHCPGRIGSAITYQGHLTLDGGPVTGAVDFDFILWDSGTGGSPIGAVASQHNVEVVNGVFTVVLDFGDKAFNGDKRWLEIHVRSPHDPTDTAPFSPLEPRQLLTSTPTAQALSGVRTSGDYINPNVISGNRLNTASQGVVGATISGGGGDISYNIVYDDFGTIGGGRGNQAGNSSDATNIQTFATVSGGSANSAQAVGAVVSGGLNNHAIGNYATVPGGFFNLAYGDYSFAAGQSAGVRSEQLTGVPGGDKGTFVWSDTSSGGFVSTGQNQFLVRAAGGAGFGTNAPLAGVHVKREPITLGGTLALEGTTHAYLTIYPDGAGAGRKAYFGFAGADTTAISLANEIADGDIILDTGAPYGKVGINVLDPLYALELPNSGDGAIGRGRANAWLTYSSRRWKENIRPIADPLDKIMRLTGVAFDWVPEHGGTPDIGFVAEDVGAVVPEIVSWEEDGENASALAYDRLTALIVEAMKEQQRQIESLRAENAALAARLAAIEARLK